MTGIKVVNLKLMIEELGENVSKGILSSFSCPLNPDVENFLHYRAIEFCKQNISATHLVSMPYKSQSVIVGYFTLANKHIAVNPKRISNTTKKRIAKYAYYNKYFNQYILAAPLIAQLGKNFANGYNTLITGNELLALALARVQQVQYDIGGKCVYVECEGKPKLIDFYRSNGFFEFDKRTLDRDETDLSGQHLIQLLKYIH